VKSPSSASQTSTLTVFGLLVVGIVSLSAAAFPADSLFRDVTVLDLLSGVSPFDLPSLAYTTALVLVGFAATLIGLSLLSARLE